MCIVSYYICQHNQIYSTLLSYRNKEDKLVETEVVAVQDYEFIKKLSKLTFIQVSHPDPIHSDDSNSPPGQSKTLQKMVSDLNQAFVERNYHDITISAKGGETISAHKFVLAGKTEIYMKKKPSLSVYINKSIIFTYQST